MTLWKRAFDIGLFALFAIPIYKFYKRQSLFDTDFAPSPASVDGPTVLKNGWGEGQPYDLQVFISDQPVIKSFKPSDLVWRVNGLKYGSFEESQLVKLDNLRIQLEGRDPMRLFAHVYLVPQPTSNNVKAPNLLYQRTKLAGKMQKPAKFSNLFANKLQLETDKEEVAYWYPDLDISVVSDTKSYDTHTLHPITHQYLSIDSNSKTYYPIVYLNDFWHIKEKRVTLDGSEKELALNLCFSPLSLFKFQLLVGFDHSFKVNERILNSQGGEFGGVDSIKEMLLSNSPYVLGLTLVVSIFHSIFDFLAFKNDIIFWKNQKDLTGLSVRSILLNTFSQFIVFLYLLEQETSFVILISSLVGLLIESWKIFRVLRVEFKPDSRFGIPWPRFHDRESYGKITKDLDEKAMFYLSLVATPLLIGYSAYSLLYEGHKSWYSWILGSLVGFVYTFGFIMMTPQLFINYKLKSVAHMPWKAFVYKALNTFIDDLFAFIIKMPTLHRVACFRDDLVFLVYLYQRWIYPVDRTRVNEFGQTFEEPTETSMTNQNEKKNN